MVGNATPDRYEIISSHPLFAELDDAEKQNFANHTVLRRFDKNQNIFLRGDVGDQLYIVVKGSVAITITSIDGRESLLNVMTKGEVIGEIALFGNTGRTADAYARSDCILLCIDKPLFLDLLDMSPLASKELIRIMIGHTTRLTERVSDLALYSTESRLGRLLISLAQQFGRAREDGINILIPLSQTELGEMIAASRQSVNKALSALERKGYLKRSDGKMTLQSIESLQEYCNMDLFESGSHYAQDP